jgi:hypothetical protein
VIQVAIEPTSFEDFVKIYTGQPLGREIEGMLQVNSFRPLTRTDVVLVTPMRREAWRRYRDDFLKAGVEAIKGWSVGLLEVQNGENHPSITAPILLGGKVHNLIRASVTWRTISVITGEVDSAAPMDNIKASLEYVVSVQKHRILSSLFKQIP